MTKASTPSQNRFFGLRSGALGLGFWLLSFSYAVNATERCMLTFDNGATVAGLPVARSIEDQRRGLSGRSDPGVGMLFIWPKAEPRALWMRDTHFPLAVGFVSDDGVLFSIEQMEADTDKFHLSMRPALEAIELPSDGFERRGLKPGSRIKARACTGKS